MSRPLRADVLGAGSTADPSAGAGYAADIGSLYLRRGTSQIWQKDGPLDTDWVLLAIAPAASFYREVAVSGPINATDVIVVARGYGAALTLTLPLAATCTAGQRLTIKDGDGEAATLPITVALAGADTIDGDSDAIIQINYGSLDLVPDGVSAWFIV